MSIAIGIAGYTLVKSGTLTLGSVDDGNDIRIKIFKGTKKIHTNQSGPEMWEGIINLGMRAQITVPFQKWDESVMAGIVGTPASVEGQVGSLGGLTGAQAISIVPTNGSGYYFPYAWVVDSYEIAKFGYEPKILTVTFEACADLTAGSTAPLYTRA